MDGSSRETYNIEGDISQEGGGNDLGMTDERDQTYTINNESGVIPTTTVVTKKPPPMLEPTPMSSLSFRTDVMREKTSGTPLPKERKVTPTVWNGETWRYQQCWEGCGVVPRSLQEWCRSTCRRWSRASRCTRRWGLPIRCHRESHSHRFHSIGCT